MCVCHIIKINYYYNKLLLDIVKLTEAAFPVNNDNDNDGN